MAESTFWSTTPESFRMAGSCLKSAARSVRANRADQSAWRLVLLRAAGARMLADGKGGSIINIASIAGMAGWKDHPPAYQSTKAAVINLTRNLACSWADRGVRVNAIAPGWFPSEMTDPFFAMGSMKAWAASTAPMGRVGNPDELAGPVLFLASDASSFVTGQTLVVDGGLSATSGYCPMPEDFYQQLEAAMPDGLGKRIVPDAK